jgi:hypothetical protein
MVDFLLDENDELTFDEGDIQLVSAEDQIAQALKIRLRRIINEDFHDSTRGIDYFGQVLGKGRDLSTITAIMQNEIALTPGVNSILDISAEIGEDRTLEVSFSVDTIYGVLENIQLEVLV